MHLTLCPKHLISYALCGGLIVPSIAGTLKGDPQAKLAPIHRILGQGSLVGGTGSATMSRGVLSLSDPTIPGKTYSLVWQDQQRQALPGPTGSWPQYAISFPTGLNGPGPPNEKPNGASAGGPRGPQGRDSWPSNVIGVTGPTGTS
jgi:hypothetical protein